MIWASWLCVRPRAERARCRASPPTRVGTAQPKPPTGSQSRAGRASPSTRPARRSHRPADPRRPHLERASSSRGKHLDEPMVLVDPRVKDLVDLGLETGETREQLPPGRGRGRSTRGGTGPFLLQDGLEQVLAHEGHDHGRQGGVVYHGCSSCQRSGVPSSGNGLLGLRAFVKLRKRPDRCGHG